MKLAACTTCTQTCIGVHEKTCTQIFNSSSPAKSDNGECPHNVMSSYKKKLIKIYNWNQGIASCRQHAKTNKPVQNDHLSHTISFLFDSSRTLCTIMIRRKGGATISWLATISMAQLVERGGVSPDLFWKLKKIQWFWGEKPDCVHLWVKFLI